MKKVIVELVNIKNNETIVCAHFNNMLIVDLKFIKEYLESKKRRDLINIELPLLSDKDTERTTVEEFQQMINEKLKVYRPTNKLNKATKKLVYRIKSFGDTQKITENKIA